MYFYHFTLLTLLLFFIQRLKLKINFLTFDFNLSNELHAWNLNPHFIWSIIYIVKKHENKLLYCALLPTRYNWNGTSASAYWGSAPGALIPWFKLFVAIVISPEFTVFYWVSPLTQWRSLINNLLTTVKMHETYRHATHLLMPCTTYIFLPLLSSKHLGPSLCPRFIMPN